MNVLRLHIPLAIACFVFSSPAFAADVLTYHNDNARTGLNTEETYLTPGMSTRTLLDSCGICR
jgi:hypothetical protein